MLGRKKGGQEPWAPRGRGCIMYHFGATLWPGVGSLCLLLAGATWAPSPNSPDAKFESKGKDGPEFGGKCWGLNVQPGSWGLCRFLNLQSMFWGPKLISEPLDWDLI